MNWTPGKIVGTVKPAGANVAPIPAPVLAPVPAPVSAPQKLIPQPVPAPLLGTTTPASGSSGTKAEKPVALKGTVQSQPTGANRILGTIKVAGSDQPGISCDQLTNKAVEEIYRDAKIGRIRASQVGALGWRGCPLKKTNKRFLNRTMNSVMQHNRRETIRTFHSSTQKLIEMDRQDDVRHRHRKRSPPKASSRSGRHGEVVHLDDDEDNEDFTKDVIGVDQLGLKRARAARREKATEEMEEGEIRSDDED
ncbi:uncharacterized protein LOC5566767 [Aedes aegypti]|uniref:Uncharacterized protein n=1 Tax=Aedes aegypti TaxID=7159 RepID=A0A6I8TZZ2_AEDAE|nr:uncharacterized protein LOC5566767 [Aedes aegypti]